MLPWQCTKSWIEFPQSALCYKRLFFLVPYFSLSQFVFFKSLYAASLSEWKNLCLLLLKQVHNILAEMVMGGMVLETNMNEIITQVDAQNKMEKSEVSLTRLSTVCIYLSCCVQYAGMRVCCTLHASLQRPCGCSLPVLECLCSFLRPLLSLLHCSWQRFSTYPLLYPSVQSHRHIMET